MTGVVSAANSLVGSTANDQVGIGLRALSNGNYVVRSIFWDNGAVVDAGAATWASGTTGVSGGVSAANSLVGSTAGDRVGNFGAAALSNGNYVVGSAFWDNGAIVDAGAAIWGSGTSGVSGVVSAANSLVGSTASDNVGIGGMTALSNGNYVVRSHNWDNGAIVNAGAATWGSGTTGVTGAVSAANSLVGSTASDFVGGNGVTALSNGNYVVRSTFWDNGAFFNAGAATWGSGTTGVTGVVSAANSLVGSTTGDVVGSGGVTALSNGNYVVRSQTWHNGAIVAAGAATWGSGTTGVTGVVSAASSLVGTTESTNLQPVVVDDVNGTFFGRFLAEGGGRVRVGDQVDTWAPATPTLFTASYSGGQTNLAWAANSENDLASYRLYRGTSAGFTPAIGNQIATPISTSYTDVGAAGGYYKLSAVDLNGNESGFALVTPNGTTGVGSESPVAFALESVRPNPASGNGLHVAFALPSGAAARLELLDVSGRRVVSREVGSLGAGRHTVNLAEARSVAPGLYWVRLTQGADRRTTRVAVIE